MFKKKVNAYNLQELLVVLVIIGILILIAMPSFMGVINKAKSIEAQQSLKTIQSLQKSHFYLNNTYSLDFNAIDFIPPKKTSEGGTANYTYEIIQATTSTFKARAVALFDADGDGVKSTWEINQDGKPIEVLKD
ncbi:MAG: type IV pilin protein [Flavobacteriaceae bacterium]|nr:type IV pilin protein [Flavobacteriaceae bacterium]MDG2275926.1 type IV pilin protein [Flavobacteriaceae bacterium]|tara:strand:- start:6475 stop:6876 length:402 start_codon:yes stop_codon:yes gene_type:complete